MVEKHFLHIHEQYPTYHQDSLGIDIINAIFIIRYYLHEEKAYILEDNMDSDDDDIINNTIYMDVGDVTLGFD